MGYSAESTLLVMEFSGIVRRLLGKHYVRAYQRYDRTHAMKSVTAGCPPS